MPTPILIDAHQDMAMNYISYRRDFRESLATIRAREAGGFAEQQNGVITSTLDGALKANVGLIFSTLFVNPPWESFGKVYNSPQEAEAQALEQIAYYDDLATHPQIKRIFTRADLETVRATWQLPIEQRVVGLVTLMEGADPIQKPDDFGAWYERGLRIVGLTWSKTRYAGGTVMNNVGSGSITPDGFALMEQIANFNAVLDLSHMSEEAYYQAFDAYDGVMIASHSNPRSFRNTDRHLSEDMICKLAERGGVIGLVPYVRFLTDDATKWNKQSVPLSLYIEAIDTICQLTGSAQHAGIGSDIDGGFGRASIPTELDSLANFNLIPEALNAKGYSDDDVEAICSGNFLRVLEGTLP